jgi:hypothetical protein
MRTSLKISAFLSWFNMIVWGFIALTGVLGALMAGNLSFLVITFLTGVTVLHSYAALQLHKSIRNPTVPLNNQTPVGIRFIGFIALFFGVLYLGDGFAVLQSPGEIAKLMEPQMPPQFKGMDLHRILRTMAVFAFVTGLCITVNVFLNFRLLRWYFLIKKSDIS